MNNPKADDFGFSAALQWSIVASITLSVPLITSKYGCMWSC